MVLALTRIKNMSKKTFTIIAILLIIIFGVTFWYFFFRTQSSSNASETESSSQNLFPYGVNNPSNGQTQSVQNSTSTTVINESGSTTVPSLIHITTTPVAGAIFLPESKNASSTIVRYIDRGTGHVYDYNFQTGITSEVANTTMPEIYEGLFSSDGSRAIFRSLDSTGAIQTVSAAIVSTTTPATPSVLSDIRFLPKNITSISVNGSRLFFIEDMGIDGSVGYISNLDGTKSQEIWSSPLEQMRSSWNDPQDIFIYSNPSASAPGYALELNSKTGGSAPIINGVTGLATAENGTGAFVFASASNNGSIQSFILDVKNNIETPLTIKSLADKCIWSTLSPTNAFCAVPEFINSNDMPDDWYQGTVALGADDIWKIDAATGKSTVLNFLSSQDSALDPENLFLDEHEQWLGFMDKGDLSLWALRLQ